MGGLRDFCITHVTRAKNEASHRVASFARIENRTMTWIGSGPSEVLELALSECKNILIE